MKNTIKQYALLFLITMFSVSTSSCLKYFKTNTIHATPSREIIDSVHRDQKMVIVHYTDKIIELKDISINGDTISGTAGEISSVTARYSKPFQNKSNHYKKIHYAEVLSHVHIYMNEIFPQSSFRLIIPRDRIARYDIYTFDKKATQNSRIIGTVAVILAGIGLFAFVLFLLQGVSALAGFL